jgi:hypothetical protein
MAGKRIAFRSLLRFVDIIPVFASLGFIKPVKRNKYSSASIRIRITSVSEWLQVEQVLYLLLLLLDWYCQVLVQRMRPRKGLSYDRCNELRASLLF